MKNKEEISLLKKYRRAFLRGLGALLPTVLTFYVIFICVEFVHVYVAMPINSFICSNLLMQTQWGEEMLIGYSELTKEEKTRLFEKKPDKKEFVNPKKAHEEMHKSMPWFPGWIIAFFLIFIAGFLVSSFVGRRLWRYGEKAIAKVPIIRSLYPYAKQITDFLFKEKQVEYSQVVLVEYPRKGVFSIAFLTGHGLKSLNTATGRELYNVFIPTSPTPMTGYVVFVAPDEIISVDISVEEALKIVISCGVFIPEYEMTETGLKLRSQVGDSVAMREIDKRLKEYRDRVRGKLPEKKSE
jgi:uncharacterized membrane protein